HQSDQGLMDWITVYEDENKSVDEADGLKAFGFSTRGEPLFPFNRNAITSLANRHLTLGEKLIFNPRRIIDFILRDILLIQRNNFENGLFPPSQFEGAFPTAEVASWLARSVRMADVRGRLGSLIVHWGGNPNQVADLALIQSEIFRAFSLPTPAEL